MNNQDAIKNLNDMLADAQEAHQLGNKIFTLRQTVIDADELIKLCKIADKLICSIKNWQSVALQNDIFPVEG